MSVGCGALIDGGSVERWPRPGGTAEPRDHDGAGDDELLRAHADGDATAFAELVGRHTEGLRRQCLRLVGDPATADDLVQEVFLRLVEHAGRLPIHGCLGPWLRTVAHRLCIDEVRRRRRQAALVDGEEGPARRGELIVDTDPWATPERALEITLTGAAVRAALRRLPEQQRRALELHVVAELTRHEVAKRLGMSSLAAQSLLHRAREGFRRKFMEQLGADAGTSGCATIGYVVEHARRAALREDRRLATERHIRSCVSCSRRYGEWVARSA